MSAPSQKYSPSNMPLLTMMLTGGFSGCVAEVATIPLDTVKVRMQIQGEGAALKYRGVGHCLITILKQEGLLTLFKGLTAGLQRQMVFASLRIGLYEPVKNFYVGKDHTGPISLGYKILAGLTTGCLGIMVANPTDIVKIRFQAEGKKPVEQQRYKGVIDAYRHIYRNEGGLAGFWIGIVPNIFRNSIINAAELSTFDQAKEMLLRSGMFKDNIYCHLASSAIAGLAAVIIGSPVDVIKTRIMNQNAAEGKAYSGVLNCVGRTFKEEGFTAFYKGLSANAGRLISWNIVMFVTLQQVRQAVFDSCYKQ